MARSLIAERALPPVRGRLQAIGRHVELAGIRAVSCVAFSGEAPSEPRVLRRRWDLCVLRTLTVVLINVAGLFSIPAAHGSILHAQDESLAPYLGTWEYHGPQVRFTLLLGRDGRGHLADEIESFPFTYSLDVGNDPARLDLTYEVDMAFGRLSHTLVRLERSENGDLLHWVSRHSDSGPPEWPQTSERTPPGVTWITFRRVEP